MFNRLKKIIVAIGIILFIILLILPTPANLATSGQKSFAVFVLCLSLWVSNIIPLAVTSLLGLVLVPLLNILQPEETFALFGNKAVFFILGALILAAGIYQTGLGTRIAFKVLKKFGRSPRSLLISILLTSALLSCIMPEHAVAALLFPIVLEIATSLGLKPLESNYGKLLFLFMAWGAIIGGITTFLGGARNPLAVGLLEKNYGITIGFFEWIKYSFPIPLLILIFAYFVVVKFVKIDIDNVDQAREALEKQVKEAGKLSLAEKKLSVVMVLVIFSWLFLSQWIDISIISILGAVSIFVLGIVEWKEVEAYVNWGVLLMYGGAIVVATSLTKTGATAWLSESIFSNFQFSPFVFLAFISLFTIFVTEGVSNVAAVAITLPLAYSIGEVYSINPVLITLAVALSGGLAFCLPMGTPPNAIAYSSGYYRINDVIKIGIILNFVSWLIYLLVAKFYWPLLGLELII